MHTPKFLYAAGSNGRGQLAIGSFQDAHTFTPCIFAGCERGELPPETSSIIAIVGGGNHTIALLSQIFDKTGSIEVWGCGDDTKGQLGRRAYHQMTDCAIFKRLTLPLEEQSLYGYTISKVAACWETSFFALTKEGQHDLLISMGGDDFGDLGIGGLTISNSVPFHVVDFSHIVGSTPYRISIIDITAGPHHVIVLLHAGNKQYITGWGTARHGQLGPLLAPSGRALSFSPSPVAIDLPVDLQLDPVLAVRAGNQHSLFLHASGRVSALGSDAKSQLRGLGTAKDVRAIDCSWNSSYLQTPTGLFSAGANARGQLGREDASLEIPLGVVNVPENAEVLNFVCGSEHVLSVLKSDRGTEVWGWGWNEHGNLGTGRLDDIKVPVKVLPSASPEPREEMGHPVGAWAGCGTSWIAISHRGLP